MWLSLDHFFLPFWALLLLVWSVTASFDHVAIAKWFILLPNPPTSEPFCPLAQHHTIWCSSQALNYLTWREHLGIFGLNRTLSLVSTTWNFMWRSRQLSSSKNDSSHLTMRSLIVHPSMLPRRAVLLCPEATRRPSLSLSPWTVVRKVTCSPHLSWLFICADSFFLKKKNTYNLYLFDWSRSQLQHQVDL